MARTVFSAGKARSGTVCASVLLQVLLLSSVGARTSVRPSMSSAARKLSEEDDHTEASFVDLLGSEPPLDHLYELFIDSGSTMDSVSWLVDVTRYLTAPSCRRLDQSVSEPFSLQLHAKLFALSDKISL